MKITESLWIISIVVVVVAAVAFVNWAMMLGWNYAVVPTFGVQEVNFWKMFVIGILAALLFKTTVTSK